MIYLASPYSHEDKAVQEERFQKVCKACAKLMRDGLMVFSPIAHSHPVAMYGVPGTWEYWKAYDTEMLGMCSEMYILQTDGWDTSRGVEAEREIASSLGLTVTYIQEEGL